MSSLRLITCDPMSDPPGYHDPACDARIRALNDWYWHHPLALAAFLALVVICMLPFLGLMWLTWKSDQDAESAQVEQ